MAARVARQRVVVELAAAGEWMVAVAPAKAVGTVAVLGMPAAITTAAMGMVVVETAIGAVMSWASRMVAWEEVEEAVPVSGTAVLATGELGTSGG